MIRLKPSIYNHIIETNDKERVLLFNTFSTALCALSKDVHRFLCSNNITLDELDSSERMVVDKLISMGFLVSADIDEVKRVQLHQNMVRYGTGELTLTIGPTMNCNMRCPYCFEAEHHQAMSQNTIQKLVGFIENYVERNAIKSLSITWYGGEPLLELDKIKQISVELISFSQNRNLSYHSSIVTNGYYLNRETAEILKSLQISQAQVTIDGLEITHNARRKLKNGEGSFWPIIKNVDECRDVLDINIRVNVDKENSGEISKLTDFFVNDMKWGGNPTIYLAPVDKCNEICGRNLEQCLTPSEFATIQRNFINKMVSYGLARYIDGNYPNYRKIFCAALCMHNFVVDAEGFLYTCWNHFGDKSKSVGNLDDPDRIGLNSNYLNWMTVSLPSKCLECIYLPVCQGGCPDTRIQSNNQPECDYRHFACIDNALIKYCYRSTK